MKYVLPVPAPLRGMFPDRCRLYAFPAEPEPPPADGFVLLDSGAYALAKRGRAIGPAHMEKLAAHVERYAGAGAIAVAPDVYLDPERTLANWRHWQTEGYAPVAPVVQFEAAHQVSLRAARRQLAVYAVSGPHPFVFISNPALRGDAAAALGMGAVVAAARETCGATWVHNLGAGWDLRDIRAWTACGFDSIDSVAYYTAAKAGEAWDGQPAGGWRETARRNAEMAARLLGEVVMEGVR